MIRSVGFAIAIVVCASGCQLKPPPWPSATGAPQLIVLGVAHDAGVPQAGTRPEQTNGRLKGSFHDPRFQRFASCLGIVDGDQRFLIEATPDFKHQLHRLDRFAPVERSVGLDGIVITHAHIGHYTGLMMLGHEVMGARGVPVHVTARMADFLRTNGPWSQLVARKNIDLRRIDDGDSTRLSDAISVTPVLVPHRQEYTDTVGIFIQGPNKRVLFLPDIDSWHEWEEAGADLIETIAAVDVAYVDGTFFANGEIPGRDMSTFPHPFITETMRRLAHLPVTEREKVRFIHLNHTNPALWPGTDARRQVEAAGFSIAEEGEVLDL